MSVIRYSWNLTVTTDNNVPAVALRLSASAVKKFEVPKIPTNILNLGEQ